MAIYKGKIRQRNSGGTYDYLLPETTIDMVNGLQSELDSKISDSDLDKLKKGTVILSDYEHLSNGNDWTIALQTACNEYNRVVVHKRIEISDTINIDKTKIIGQGKNIWGIVGKISDVTKPMIRLGSIASLQDIQVGYSEELLTNNETSGQRVVIVTTGGVNNYTAQKYKILENVKINGAGTGITDDKSVFSTSIEDLEICNFTFAGLIFNSPNRTGNFYKNIYIHNYGKDYTPTWGFRLSGEESETNLVQINVEHTKILENAVSFDGIKGIQATSIHIEGVELMSSTAFVSFNKSFGKIGALTAYYTRSHKPNQKLIELKEGSIVSGGSSGTSRSSLNSSVLIDTLFAKGLNRPDANTYPNIPNSDKTLKSSNSQPFYFVYRDASYSDGYYLKIGDYKWYTWTTINDDTDKYIEFMTTTNSYLTMTNNNSTKLFEETKEGTNIKFNNTYAEDLYYSKISAMSVIGRPDIDSNQYVPNVMKTSNNSTINIDNASYEVPYTLRRTKATYDEYDICSGVYTKRINEYVFRNTTSVNAANNDFVIYSIPSVKDSTGLGLTMCSHIADRYARTEFNAFYLRRDILQNSGIILSSDNSTTAITKIKDYFENQYLNGTPFTLWVTLPVEVKTVVNPTLINLDKNTIYTSSTNTTIKATYNVATNKHSYYDSKITQLTNAIIALGGSI